MAVGVSIGCGKSIERRSSAISSWQVLFRWAIAAAGEEAPHKLFYPHSYLFGYLQRKAAFATIEAKRREDSALLDARIAQLITAALYCANHGCGRVLRDYRYVHLSIGQLTYGMLAYVRCQAHALAVLTLIRLRWH